MKYQSRTITKALTVRHHKININNVRMNFFINQRQYQEPYTKIFDRKSNLNLKIELQGISIGLGFNKIGCLCGNKDTFVSEIRLATENRD